LDWLDAMVKKIEQSQDRVWVEVYIFTEKRLQKALIDAHKRGIDVKIILEKNVYKAPSLNKKTFQNFEKNGIDVVWSDWEDYSLNHTKMMILDNEFLLSTGNYSYSTFKINREFFISGKDSEML
jgi:phosphatidylserine/phosphatidylglycerophosphate/cardiolipin synthase-like enzyme